MSDKIKICPKCGSDCITIESSREMQKSIISCDDCEYSIHKNIPEEDLIILWNKKRRLKSYDC